MSDKARPRVVDKKAGKRPDCDDYAPLPQEAFEQHPRPGHSAVPYPKKPQEASE